MKSYFIEADTAFNNTTFKTGWGQRQLPIQKGDNIISFVGEYHGLKGTKKEPYLASDNETLAHMVIEHYGINEADANIRLRFLATIIRDELGDGFSRNGHFIRYLAHPLSIANIRHTKRSTLIHVGLIIDDIEDSAGKLRLGLDHFDIIPKDFMLRCAINYCQEINESIGAKK